MLLVTFLFATFCIGAFATASWDYNIKQLHHVCTRYFPTTSKLPGGSDGSMPGGSGGSMEGVTTVQGQLSVLCCKKLDLISCCLMLYRILPVVMYVTSVLLFMQLAHVDWLHYVAQS